MITNKNKKERNTNITTNTHITKYKELQKQEMKHSSVLLCSNIKFRISSYHPNSYCIVLMGG